MGKFHGWCLTDDPHSDADCPHKNLFNIIQEEEDKILVTEDGKRLPRANLLHDKKKRWVQSSTSSRIILAKSSLREAKATFKVRKGKVNRIASHAVDDADIEGSDDAEDGQNDGMGDEREDEEEEEEDEEEEDANKDEV